jgi:hypothetical protein
MHRRAAKARIPARSGSRTCRGRFQRKRGRLALPAGRESLHSRRLWEAASQFDGGEPLASSNDRWYDGADFVNPGNYPPKQHSAERNPQALVKVGGDAESSPAGGPGPAALVYLADRRARLNDDGNLQRFPRGPALPPRWRSRQRSTGGRRSMLG